MLWKYKYCVVVLLVIVFSLVFRSGSNTYATTGINQELSFEGKIATTSTGVNLANGTYNMEFKIYTGCTNNTGSGCTTAWTEDYLVSNANSSPEGITFNGGTFQVNLGANCAFSGGTCLVNSSISNTAINWNTYPLYLSVQIGSTTSCTPATNFTANCGGDGVMSPYILLTSTPYSLNSGQLGGLTSSEYGQLAATTQTWSGQNIFADSSNSTTALEVNNVAGTSILNADTTNSIIDLNQSNINFTNLSPPGALTIGSYSGSTGPNGAYYYVVTFLTANGGETNYGTVSAKATTTGTQNINLTGIPTGPTGVVTGRNIYRTIAGGASTGPFQLVTTIANDTATTYTDATADGSLGVGAPSINSTNGNGLISVDGSSILTVDQPSQDVALGYLALATNTSGTANVAIGSGALYLNTTGNNNFALGTNALAANTTGSNSVAVGINDLEASNGGQGNVTIGNYDGENITTGNLNILIGYDLSTPTAGTSDYLNIGDVLYGNTATGAGWLESLTDAAGAFEIENSVGSVVSSIGTADNNYITYSNFDVGSFTSDATGWQAVSPGLIVQNTTVADSFRGADSLKLTTTTSGGGAQTDAFDSTVPAGAYYLSFYVLPNLAMNATGFTVTLDDTTTHTCTPTSETLSTTGFRQIGCTVTTTGNLTYVEIAQNDTTARTIYIGGVALLSGTTPFVYTEGTDYFNGLITSPLEEESNSNSEDAFDIFQSNGTLLFNVDTTDDAVGIGLTTNPGALLSVGGTTGNFQVVSTGAITTAGSLTFSGTTALSIVGPGTGGLTVGVTSGPLTLSTTTSGTLTLSSAGTLAETSGGTSNATIDTSSTSADITLGATNAAVIAIGSITGSASVQHLLQLNSYDTLADSPSSCTTTSSQGALYYNNVSNSIRACIDGSWQDLISTQDLGLLLFGVVPNSGTDPGDLIGASATATLNTGGPCKVDYDSTTTVYVNSCLAYSDGREVSVPATAISISALGASTFEDICLNTSGTPALTGSTGTSFATTALANLTTSSSTTYGQPLLCLATIETGTSAGSMAAGHIYDLRTFTTTTKTYATIATAADGFLGALVSPGATTSSDTVVFTPGTSLTSIVQGVVVANSHAAGTAAVPNLIIAISGPQWIAAQSGAPDDIITPSATGAADAGLAVATAATGTDAYSDVGVNLLPFFATSCTTAAPALTDCQSADFTYLNIH